MATRPRFSLVPFDKTTQFAPLVALGCYLREVDLLAPLWSRLTFPQPMHVEHPTTVLLDLWVSMLAGCSSVSQINTRLRPDHLLAQAWGRRGFHEQSAVARVLDACQPEQVDQLRDGVEAVYRWIGQAPSAWPAASALTLDIDLTGLPAGPQAEGSTKGYFSGKRGRTADSCVESVPLTTTKAWRRSSIPGTR